MGTLTIVLFRSASLILFFCVEEVGVDEFGRHHLNGCRRWRQANEQHHQQNSCCNIRFRREEQHSFSKQQQRQWQQQQQQQQYTTAAATGPYWNWCSFSHPDACPLLAHVPTLHLGHRQVLPSILLEASIHLLMHLSPFWMLGWAKPPLPAASPPLNPLTNLDSVNPPPSNAIPPLTLNHQQKQSHFYPLWRLGTVLVRV